jgi:hypothetical protein
MRYRLKKKMRAINCTAIGRFPGNFARMGGTGGKSYRPYTTADFAIV